MNNLITCKMRTLSDFKPPKPNQALIAFCKLLVPWYAKLVDQLSVEFLDDSDLPLNFLKGKPAVIVINHSDKEDPLVAVAIARHIREAAYWIVAREVFDWHHGLLGWLFQRLGCFSVKRGIADFQSINTTREILTHADRRLVVFPEAEVTGDDLKVHEVSRAFIHMLLAVQGKIARSLSPQSIWVLPVGVSYRLESNLDESITKTLSLVERQLGICNGQPTDLIKRVTLAMETVLQSLSQHYNCILPEDQPQHRQVRILARHICRRISKYHGVEHEKDQKRSCEKILYALRNQLAGELDSRKARAPHQQKLWHDASIVNNQFIHDLDRVERLLIVQRVLEREQTPIQVCRIVDFLESETCGHMTKKGRQSACVFFGKPIEILPHLALYKSCKNAAVDELSACVREQLQSALDCSHGHTASAG